MKQPVKEDQESGEENEEEEWESELTMKTTYLPCAALTISLLHKEFEKK